MTNQLQGLVTAGPRAAEQPFNEDEATATELTGLAALPADLTAKVATLLELLTKHTTCLLEEDLEN